MKYDKKAIRKSGVNRMIESSKAIDLCTKLTKQIGVKKMRKVKVVSEKEFNQIENSKGTYEDYCSRVRELNVESVEDKIQFIDLEYVKNVQLLHVFGGTGGTLPSSSFNLMKPEKNDSSVKLNKAYIRRYLKKNFELLPEKLNSKTNDIFDRLDKDNKFWVSLTGTIDKERLNSVSFGIDALKPIEYNRVNNCIEYTIRRFQGYDDKKTCIVGSKKMQLSTQILDDLKHDLFYEYLSNKELIFAQYRNARKKTKFSFWTFCRRYFKRFFLERVNFYLYEVDIPVRIRKTFHETKRKTKQLKQQLIDVNKFKNVITFPVLTKTYKINILKPYKKSFRINHLRKGKNLIQKPIKKPELEKTEIIKSFSDVPFIKSFSDRELFSTNLDNFDDKKCLSSFYNELSIKHIENGKKRFSNTELNMLRKKLLSIPLQERKVLAHKCNGKNLTEISLLMNISIDKVKKLSSSLKRFL